MICSTVGGAEVAFKYAKYASNDMQHKYHMICTLVHNSV